MKNENHEWRKNPAVVNKTPKTIADYTGIKKAKKAYACERCHRNINVNDVYYQANNPQKPVRNFCMGCRQKLLDEV